MRELPPGWATDLAVLELTGSTVEDRDDHLLVRTPANPTYHWGNCLFVTDDSAVEDAGRWTAAFEAAFPDASWIAIGLIRMPADVSAWDARGIAVELDDVLTADAMPRQAACPEGYVARRLDGPDWEQSVVRSSAQHPAASAQDAEQYEQFVRAQVRTRRDLSDRDRAAFFGAFADDVLVSELGIVQCGSTARYQSVGTSDGHRRRGLASHLLGVAARWAADHGCDHWVIVTEATNPAGRVYRAAGFVPADGGAEAYRPPA
jgi:GNAT superfamily N-acetyltransferase